jgi:hypothetical protein
MLNEERILSAVLTESTVYQMDHSACIKRITGRLARASAPQARCLIVGKRRNLRVVKEIRRDTRARGR